MGGRGGEGGGSYSTPPRYRHDHRRESQMPPSQLPALEAIAGTEARAAPLTSGPSRLDSLVAPGTEDTDGSLYCDLSAFASTWGFSTIMGEANDADAQRGGEDYVKYSSRKVRRVNIGELGKWIARMAPRGAGDHKPMCVLLQAVLRDIISSKLQHNNDTIVHLRATLHTMQKLLQEIHDQYSATLTTLSTELAEEHQMNMFQSLVTAASKMTAKFRSKKEQGKAKLTLVEMEEEMGMLRRSMHEMRLRLDRERREGRTREDALQRELEREKKEKTVAAAAAVERIVYLEGVVATMQGAAHGRGDGHSMKAWMISAVHREHAAELAAMSRAEALARLLAMLPEDAARTLAAMDVREAGAALNLMDPTQAALLLALMPPDVSAAMLVAMDAAAAAAILALMELEVAAATLAEMDPAIAAVLMALLEPDVAADVLERMTPPQAASILRLMHSAVAARLVTTLEFEFFAEVLTACPVERASGVSQSAPSPTSNPGSKASSCSRVISARGAFGSVMDPAEAATILSKCQDNYAAKAMLAVKGVVSFPHFAAILAGFHGDGDGEADGNVQASIIKEMSRVTTKRMDLSELGGDEMDRLMATLSGEAVASILSLQPAVFVAGTVAKLSVPDGAAMLLAFSMGQRSDVLAAMPPELRESMLDYLNANDRIGGGETGNCVCPRCGLEGPIDLFSGDLEDMAAALGQMDPAEAAKMIEALDEKTAAKLLLAMDLPEEGVLAAAVLGQVAALTCQALRHVMRAEDEAKTAIIYGLLDPTRLSSYKSKKLTDLENFDPNFLEETSKRSGKAAKHRPLSVEFTPPPAWLEYLGASNLKHLLKIWAKGGKLKITVPKCRGMIAKMYEMKISVDKANVRAEKLTLPLVDFVCIFFDNNFGLKKIAQQNLVKFIFSVREIYAEGVDPLVCTFVRLCGLFHPLPACALNFLLGSADLAAGGLSGGGQEFAKPQNFWAQWVGGKGINFPLKKAKDIASLAFIHMEQATIDTVVLPAVVEAVQANTTGKEGHDDVPVGKLSLGMFLECLVLVQVRLNFETEPETLDALTANASDAGNRNLTFDDWRAALKKDIKCHRPPNEGAVAFMYARGHALEHHVTKKLSKAIQSGASIMQDLGEDPNTVSVSVRSLASSFNWNYGVICEAGVRADGTSLVYEARSKAEGKGDTRAVKKKKQ